MPTSSKNKTPLPPAPTLYAIIAMKLFKGLFFAVLALIIYAHSDNDVPQEFRDMLSWLKLNPEGKFWANLLAQADGLTQARIVHFAVATMIYSLFAAVEGVGLIFRFPWAGWLSIGESAFFIPIEVYELGRKFTWFVFVILILNTFMVSYLYANRERLFRHHGHPPAPDAGT
jgi:uncharacterized membrane protein (DUF2068 family)